MIKRILEKPEYVLGYINHKSKEIVSTKLIRDNFILFLVLAIPTGFLGIYREISIPIIMSFIIIEGIWSITIVFSNKKKYRSVILFNGVYGVFFSLTCIIAAYKLLSAITVVSIIEIISMFLLYFSCIITYNLYVLRTIKKGWYLSEKANKSFPSAIALSFTFLGLSLGKLIVRSVDNDQIGFLIVGICMIAFSILYSTFSHNFLKYYFIRKMKDYKVMN